MKMENTSTNNLFEWELDKDLNSFLVIPENMDLELGYISSRSNAIRYLVERCKIAEEKLRGHNAKKTS